jgi:hypothetical protein
MRLGDVRPPAVRRQHDYTFTSSTTIERWGLAETVLFCRNCGDTRKVEIPA